MAGYCWGCARLINRGVYCWHCAEAMPDHRPVHYGAYRVCRLTSERRIVVVMRSTAYAFVVRWLDSKRARVGRGRAGRVWIEQAMLPARRSV